MKLETTATPCCDIHGRLERPRYFPRKVVTDADLTLDQDYLRQRLRTHNRLLHGWGVVCGLEVCRVRRDGEEVAGHVRIKPGFALAPTGDEIHVACAFDVDLKKSGACGPDECLEPGAEDPWCGDTQDERPPGPVYLAIRYCPVPTRPVRAEPIGCGCDESACEYSRWRDGFEIGFLPECPESHRERPKDPFDHFRPPQCPPCPESDWVVLACIDVGDGCEVESIDNCDCRRLVVHFGQTWTRCQHGEEGLRGEPEEGPWVRVGEEVAVPVAAPVAEEDDED